MAGFWPYSQLAGFLSPLPQGVWNATDGYTLTDPVIHHHSGTRHNGATDKGRDGMRDFFRTHTCNPLCRMLGLSAPPKFI